MVLSPTLTFILLVLSLTGSLQISERWFENAKHQQFVTMKNKQTCLFHAPIGRKKALFELFTISNIVCPASAMNLPQGTGADLSKTGTPEKLARVVAVKKAILDAKHVFTSESEITSAIKNLTVFSMIPNSEDKFKRIFDEYSDPVSYKQKFLDQNAFLVYYTKGFDGPNRPSIESGELPKQTLQYGARNDAWVAYEDFLAEISFAQFNPAAASIQEIVMKLDKTLGAIESYLEVAPYDDLSKANAIVFGK